MSLFEQGERKPPDGGKAQLEVADFEEMQGFLSSRPWKDFGQDACEVGNTGASSSSMASHNTPSQLAIMDEDPVVKWAAIAKKPPWRPRKHNNDC